VKDVVWSESEDDIWWMHLEDGRILKFIHEVEMFRKTV
jgi:hypothetical protein